MKLTRLNLIKRSVDLSEPIDRVTWEQVKGDPCDLWLKDSWILKCGLMYRYFNSEKEIIYYLANL